MNKINSDKNAKYLLPLVLIVWGFFFFRVFKACNPDAETIIRNNAITTFKAPEIKQKEEFELLPVERNPFLGTVNIKSNKNSGEYSANSKNTEATWPTIQYHGLIQNAESKEKVFILNINGQQFLLNQREPIQYISVVRGNEEKVTLRFQGKTQEFKKI